MTALLSVVFALSACGNSKSNTIVEAELTDRENAILSTLSNQSFVFDFNIDREYSEVTVWVEKYEFGKRVDIPTYIKLKNVLQDSQNLRP